MKIDASGHSAVVRNNAADTVDKIFDTFEKLAYSAIDCQRATFGCQYSEFWGWQGDGGLCVFFDKRESIAVSTALLSAKLILEQQLPKLRDEANRCGLKGSISIRIAVHKGTFIYRGDNQRGSIHSRDINFVSHLEQSTPHDTLLISEDVYRACPSELLGDFHKMDFPFEGKIAWAYTSPENFRAKNIEWISSIEIGDSIPLTSFHQRPSEEIKATLFKSAQTEVIDFGTSLSTCAQYLNSTRRPAFYRTQVIDLLDRGINFTGVALDPESEIAEYYGQLRGENLREKIHRSLDEFKQFARSIGKRPGKFRIKLYSSLPYYAAILIDPKDHDGVMIYAPYMPSSPLQQRERADGPHFLCSKRKNPTLFSQISLCIDDTLKRARTVNISR